MVKTKVGPLPDMKEFESFLKDISTTKYHQRLIDKAVKIAKAIDNVEGVLLKGSLGLGEGDVFSDIDFQIIHEGDSSASQTILELIIDELEEVESIIQCFPSTAFPNDCIIYLHPFVKFELSVATCDEISARWRAGSAKILFDRKGLAKGIVDKAKAISFNIDDVMPTLIGRAPAIPVFCFITAGHLVRGEELTALADIDWIRNDLLTLCGWLLGYHDEGTRRAENRFPKEILDYYRRSRVKSADEIWDGLQILLDWYEEWFVPEFDKMSIPHSQMQVSKMRDVLHLLSTK
ncbi:MAG: nucleotidyltransferase domain-containing protein [Candidatus Thorarchaeota archaeon]